MYDPHTTQHGNTYEKKNILHWFTRNQHKTIFDPISNQQLTSLVLYPNRPLKNLILQFVKEQLSTTQGE